MSDSQNETGAFSQGISHFQHFCQVAPIMLVVDPSPKRLLHCVALRCDGEELALRQHGVCGTWCKKHSIFLWAKDFLTFSKELGSGVDNFSQVHVRAQLNCTVNLQGIFAEPSVVEWVDEEYGCEDVPVEDFRQSTAPFFLLVHQARTLFDADCVWNKWERVHSWTSNQHLTMGNHGAVPLKGSQTREEPWALATRWN